MRWAGQRFWYCSLEWLTALLQSHVDEDYSLLLSADQSSSLSKTRVSNCHLCKLREGRTCSCTHYHHLDVYKSSCGETPECCRRAGRDALASLLRLLSLWLPQHWPAGGTSAFHHTGWGAPTPCTGHSQVMGGPRVRDCQVLSHWITLLHDCCLCEPSCGSAFLIGPRSHRGNFRTKKTPRKVWRKEK